MDKSLEAGTRRGCIGFICWSLGGNGEDLSEYLSGSTTSIRLEHQCILGLRVAGSEV